MSETAEAIAAWRLLCAAPSKLPRVSGRAAIRGMALRTAGGEKQTVGRYRLDELVDPPEFSHAKWISIDFAECELPYVRMEDSVVGDCTFEGCDCSSWHVQRCKFLRVRFSAVDFRSAALGLAEVVRNRFLDVTFDRVDLRGSMYWSAEFVRCTFTNCKLKGVDFAGSTFEECTFVGKLDDVTFRAKDDHDTLGKPPPWPENSMRRCDFSRASLMDVDFRDLDLADVTWPIGDGHILIKDYKPTLRRVLAATSGRNHPDGRCAFSWAKTLLDRAGPNRTVGVVHRKQLVSAGGEAFADEFLSFCEAQSRSS